MNHVVIWYATALVIWGCSIWLLIRRGRRWDAKKARRDRRLLVREGEQTGVARDSRQVSVGWPSSDGRITAVVAPRKEARETSVWRSVDRDPNHQRQTGRLSSDRGVGRIRRSASSRSIRPGPNFRLSFRPRIYWPVFR